MKKYKLVDFKYKLNSFHLPLCQNFHLKIEIILIKFNLYGIRLLRYQSCGGPLSKILSIRYNLYKTEAVNFFFIIKRELHHHMPNGKPM